MTTSTTPANATAMAPMVKVGGRRPYSRHCNMAISEGCKAMMMTACSGSV